MQSVYSGINLRLRLLRINVVNTWQQETAYFGDSLGNIASTVIYTLTYLVFINVIFANVHTIAGYSRDQMLFLLFINQINFFLTYGWSYSNMQNLVQEVNRGAFDLTLIKPLPTLWYASTKRLSVISILRDATVPLTIFALAVGWSTLHIGLGQLLAGSAIMLLGQVAMNAFFFFLVAPVFWFGQASNLISVGYSFTSMEIPNEGVIPSIRVWLTAVVPCLLPTALATSVMLGKTTIASGLIIAVGVAAALVWAKITLWRAALRNYTSASS